MISLNHKIFKIIAWGIGTIVLFLSFLYADMNMVGFSEFKFLSWGNEISNVNFEMTWGDTTWFSLIIYNKEPIAMTYKIGFVDAGTTNESFAQKACLGQHETSQFGNYVTWDISFFTIPANSTITKTVSMKFPKYYSWMYHGCVLFYPSMTPLNTNPGANITEDINTLPRRGGFVDVFVHPDTVTVQVKAFPSNRVYQSTNNANTWILKIYDTNKTLIATSPLFTLNGAGTGEVEIGISPGIYYIVFKGQSHLASYLSWVFINSNGLDIFDFTTGTNLYNSQQLNSSQDDGYRYQTAGDLKNSQWVYDSKINGNDISIITQYGFQEWGIGVLDPRNLNGDTSINASDISVIGVNFGKTDPFFENTMFTW